jgi:putative phosphoesterase
METERNPPSPLREVIAASQVRIALVADTHSASADGADLPDWLFPALDGVDRILHLGDMGAVGALDRFARVAPVLATRGAHAVGDDARIAPGPFVIEAGGCAIGALFDLAKPGVGFHVSDGALSFPDGPLPNALHALFGRRVDVVAFAATHRPFLIEREGVLFVNPGSPNLPAVPGKNGRGTLALLELDAGRAQARIVQL